MGPAKPVATGVQDQPYRLMPSSVRGLAWAVADIRRDPDWSRRLRHHLDQLGAALHDHVRVTEGANGRYAEVVGEAPRLARAAKLLTLDHSRLVSAVAALQQRVVSDTAPADLRPHVAMLLRLLERHRQRGIDLVLRGVLPPDAVDEHGPALVVATCLAAGDDPRTCEVSVRRGWASTAPSRR